MDDSNNSACPVDNCEPSSVMTELVALAAVAVCAADWVTGQQLCAGCSWVASVSGYHLSVTV